MPNIDPNIVQTIRTTYPAVRRISELPDIADIDNKETIEANSYIVLANESEQKNYKKQFEDVKSEIKKAIKKDIKDEFDIELDNNYSERISSLEQTVQDILDNGCGHHGGGGSGGGDNPPQPGTQTTYYFWLIDENHINNYLSQTSPVLYNAIIEKAVNSSVNSCPFIARRPYSVYYEIQNKFSDFNAQNNSAYLIIPKQFIDTMLIGNQTYVLINNNILTTNGFNFIVKEIGTTEYKLDVNNENDNKVGYVIIKLVDEITTGMNLTI